MSEHRLTSGRIFFFFFFLYKNLWTICIDWYIICQHQKGLNHSGSGERMSGRWCSLEKNWRKTQKINRYQHTHKHRERERRGLVGPLRADKSGLGRWWGPLMDCIVLLKGADLPCVGGYEAGIEEQGEGNHYWLWQRRPDSWVQSCSSACCTTDRLG